MHYQRKIDAVERRLESLKQTGEAFDRMMLYAMVLLVVGAFMRSGPLVLVAFLLSLLCALLRFCAYLAAQRCRVLLMRYQHPDEPLFDWRPDD